MESMEDSFEHCFWDMGGSVYSGPLLEATGLSVVY